MMFRAQFFTVLRIPFYCFDAVMAASLISALRKTKQSPWVRPSLLNQQHQANLCDPVQEEEMLLVNTLELKRMEKRKITKMLTHR